MNRLAPISGQFGSFDPVEITYLLHDVGDTVPSLSTEDRESRMKQGAHYAEVLPIELPPSQRYLQAVDTVTQCNAEKVATYTRNLAAQIARGRRENPVLVSIARGGCPAGILVRRALTMNWGRDVPHYAISVIKGHGVDPAALFWLHQRYDAADLIFIDGWTGKGGIANEVRETGGSLYVLADPMGVADHRGSHDDVLVPSACLNALTHGMISRTVLATNRGQQFDGARAYPRSRDDRSARFLDAVTAYLEKPDGADSLPELSSANRRNERQAFIDVQASRYARNDTSRIRAGVGEVMRVMLRRTPSAVLLRDVDSPNNQPLLVLAEERSLDVTEDRSSPWEAVAVLATAQ